MVVSEDDAGAAMTGCIGDDRLQREVGCVLVPVVMAEVQAPGLIVDMGDEQPLAQRVSIAEATGEEVPGGPLAVKRHWQSGALVVHGRNLRFNVSDGLRELTPLLPSEMDISNGLGPGR